MNKPILLVEDNPMDVDLTLRAFRKNNLVNKVEIARDGEEALEYINKWKNGEPLPAVILLDLKLPKVDGLDVLRELKSNTVSQNIPVVVLTSSSLDHDVEESYRIGANSFIVKPVDFQKFLEVAAQIQLYWTVINRN